ncbi:MAG: hypothetical protein ACOYNI_08870 [Acidimicrobiia bacterium]
MVPEHVRPLRVSEVVDGGFALARRALARCAPLTLAVILPVELVIWWAQYRILENAPTRGFTFGRFRFSGWESVAVGGLQLVALALAVAVCCSVTVDAYVGTSPPTWRGSLTRAVRRLGGIVIMLFIGSFVVLPLGLIVGALLGLIGILLMFVAYVLGGVAVALWFCLALGPLAFMVAWYATAFPALFAEGVSPGKAMGRGFQLGTRRIIQNTGAVLMTFGVAAVAWFSLQSLLALLLRDQSLGSGIWDTGVSVLLGIVVTIFVAPALAGVFTAMYFDARVRREGLDLAWALREDRAT